MLYICCQTETLRLKLFILKTFNESVNILREGQENPTNRVSEPPHGLLNFSKQLGLI